MTPNQFFNVALKLLGIFFLRDFLQGIPELLSFLSVTLTGSRDIYFSQLVAVVISFCATGFVAYFLIFRSASVMQWLKLDDEFDVFPNLPAMALPIWLNLAIVLLGAWFIGDTLPHLCRQLFLFWHRANFFHNPVEPYPQPDGTYFIVYAVKVLVGLLLIGYRSRIVRFIERADRPREA
jgi:hypothetical protein